jgi:DeoR/GlpR family transcriptional regulator of sugar metabolism
MRTQAQAIRHVAILETLRAGGMTTVEGLRRQLLAGEDLEVAVSTIRRDLLKMEETGSVVRKRGAFFGHEYGSGRHVSYDGWGIVKS